MFNTYPNGISPEVLPCETPKSTNCDIPVGTEWSPDGVSKFRWAFIADGGYYPGHVAISLGTAKNYTITTSVLKSVAGGNNHGNKVKDIEVTLYGASGLSATLANAFDNGTFVVVSGIGKGHRYRVRYCQTGSTGLTKLCLYDPLVAKLSSNSYGYLEPNPYYGLVYASTQASVGTLNNVSAIVRGAFTVSDAQNGYGDTSGYQWVQTKGPGVARCNFSVTRGQLLGVGATSGALSSHVLASVAVLKSGSLFPVARATSTPGAAGKFISCEWFIEK